MVRRAQGRYRKVSGEISTTVKSRKEEAAAEDRKAYAGKVRSLIERKHRYHHRNVIRRTSSALRGVLSNYPKHLGSSWSDDWSVSCSSSGCSNSSCELLEEVYESQKLNFRRMISNLSRGELYETTMKQYDVDSWTDMESNFSLIYEPNYSSGRGMFALDDVDDITLTLEKVKNMKNVTAKNNNSVWDCSSCDYCDRFTPDCSDAESFVSSCASCLRNYYNRLQMVKMVEAEGKTYRNVTPRLSRRDSWTNSEFSETYEPVPAEHVVWSSRIKKLKKKLRSSDYCSYRLKFADEWSDYKKFTPKPLAIDSKERKMKELIEKLKEDLDSDWDSNGSVSLGLIYIPLEEAKKKDVGTGAALSKTIVPTAVPSSPVSSTTKSFENAEQHANQTESDNETLTGGSDELDPLGSLESLIFEPKDVEDTSGMCPEIIEHNTRQKASNVMQTRLSREDNDRDRSRDKETLVLGNYWDWTAGNVQKVEENVSGLCSDCKTCAGETSVMSWTYIGRQNNLGLNGERGESAVECSSVTKKKEVTWKMIVENRKGTVSSTNECEQAEVEQAKHPQQFNETQLIDIYSSWSEMESLLFPEETTSLSENDFLTLSRSNVFPNGGRMSCYRDDWLWWDQQRKSRVRKRSDATWRTKAKRMLLWMHLSQEGTGSVSNGRWIGWKAKQRGSILWLIGKANNNKVPDDLKEPYYKDHDDQDQLKPLIVHALATAEYYCLALGNIYADPNYHNLNHWGVIQALARKGVYVAEPSDVALTETMLIQTSPIRMSAHMAVIEAIMALYLKETITVERIVHAVKRFIPPGGPIELPGDIEDALVFWINKVCVRMKHRIEEELGIATSEVQKLDSENKIAHKENRPADAQEVKPVESGDKSNNMADKVAPPLSLLQDLSDLNDGCCLAALISYYCPTALRWQAICLNSPMSMSDSLYNLQLVQKFCRDQLPCDPCCLTLEDMVYQHSSVTQNILVFLAELFYMFEIRPVKCVYNAAKQDAPVASSETIRAAGLPNRNGFNESGLISSATKRSFQQPVSPIPDLRTSCSNSYYNSVPDLNRISPKTNGPVIREPLLPRRQHSQHERMHDRNKRFSFSDSPKPMSAGPSTNTTSNSIRRSHSVQDIEKNGSVDPAQIYTETEAESAYYSTSPVARKPIDDQTDYISTSELYLRPLPGGDVDQLMPAVIKPHKEKNNKESKPEELGEYPVNRTNRVLNNRDLSMKDNGYHFKRQSSPEKCVDYNLNNDDYEENEIPTYLEIKPNGRCDFPDNRQIEESLTKKPYIISNDVLMKHEALESLGSSESGVFLEHLPKKALSTTSFAQLSKLRENQKGINIVYMQHERDGMSGGGGGGGKYPAKSSFLQKGKSDTITKGDRKTSFAELPNQTTWQQHQVNNSSQENSNSTQELPLVSQLADIRLKLEEKRRHIETEKRKMDMMMGRARQRMGKTAFLQVVTRGKSTGQEEDEDLTESLNVSGSSSESDRLADNKELSSKPSNDGDKNYEEYNRSLEHLTSSLSDLQSDIHRLTLQQDNIQKLMHNGLSSNQQPIEQPNQFYLHDQQQMQPTMQPMWSNRSSPQDYMYGPHSTIPRSQSREQLYQPLQRTQSREHLMGTMVNPNVHQHQMMWGNEQMMPQPYSVGPMYSQQAYIEQPGFNLHSQSPHFIPMYGNNSMVPSGDSYGGNYVTYQSMPMMTMEQHQRGPPSSSQMPVDVSCMSHGGPVSSQSQSPMTYHRSTQPPRPPSRPSSAPANSGPVVSGPCLPMKTTPVMAPLEVCMEPQSVHFIDTSDNGDDSVRTNQEVEDVMAATMGNFHGGPSSLEHVMSGTATYRVREPLSPTRPVLGKTFRVSKTKLHSPPPKEIKVVSPVTSNAKPLENDVITVDKGFFVPFDDHDIQPRKPKPLINSAKKVPKTIYKSEAVAQDRSNSSSASSSPIKRFDKSSSPFTLTTSKDQSFNLSSPKRPSTSTMEDKEVQEVVEDFDSVISDAERTLSFSKADTSVGFVISEELKDSDESLTEEEMQRRKERILMSVIKRKEQQESARSRKEFEAAKRREKEQRKQEAVDRKKEEDRERRNAILEQYRQRKAAMEEQEGDRDTSRTATLPKPKVKPSLKPRPKSLHESALTGHEDRHVDRLTRGIGGRGSQSNIASVGSENGTDFKYMDRGSVIGRATPPRRAPSPGQNSYDRHHPPSPISYQCLPGGLPAGLVSRRPVAGAGAMMFNDTASDSCSTASSTAVEYTGPKLFKQPTAKSNRGIIINAINTVLAGAVNNDIKRHVLEEITQSDSKHFLILFRDAGCQFRALYSYSPEREEVIKLYGTGPKQIAEKMINKFFKYNCGGRIFSDIQTKHLTVTIDAFTIHNSLWQAKKVVQGKKDY